MPRCYQAAFYCCHYPSLRKINKEPQRCYVSITTIIRDQIVYGRCQILLVCRWTSTPTGEAVPSIEKAGKNM